MNGRRWTVACCLAPLAAAVLALPEPPGEVRYEKVQHFSVGAERERYRNRVDLLRGADSRAAAIAAVSAHIHDTAHLIVVHAADVPDALAVRVRNRVAQDLAEGRRHDSLMKVVVDIAVDTGRVVAGMPVEPWTSTWAGVNTDLFVPGFAGSLTACALVLHVTDPWMITPAVQVAHSAIARAAHVAHPTFGQLETQVSRGPLANCLWFADYGVPGRGVAQWLDSTAFTAIRIKWPEVGTTLADFTPRAVNEPWNTRIQGFGRAGPQIAACAAGRPGACTTYFLSTTSPMAAYFLRQSPGRLSNRRGNSTSYGDELPSRLMAAMETDLGPEQLEQFWKSDLPVPQAFENAHGVPLNSWLRQQVVAIVGSYHAGPLPDAAAIATCILTCLVFVGAAVYDVGKRARF